MPSRFFVVWMCMYTCAYLQWPILTSFFKFTFFRHFTKGLICSKSKIFELSDYDMHFLASLDLEYCTTPTLRPLRGNIANPFLYFTYPFRLSCNRPLSVFNPAPLSSDYFEDYVLQEGLLTVAAAPLQCSANNFWIHTRIRGSIVKAAPLVVVYVTIQILCKGQPLFEKKAPQE